MNLIDLLNNSKRHFNRGSLGMLGDNGPKEFQIYPGSKEIEEGVKILWEGENKEGIRDIGSWGVAPTQELQDSMEEPRS
jgi:hypothetical protein